MSQIFEIASTLNLYFLFYYNIIGNSLYILTDIGHIIKPLNSNQCDQRQSPQIKWLSYCIQHDDLNLFLSGKKILMILRNNTKVNFKHMKIAFVEHDDKPMSANIQRYLFLLSRQDQNWRAALYIINQFIGQTLINYFANHFNNKNRMAQTNMSIQELKDKNFQYQYFILFGDDRTIFLKDIIKILEHNKDKSLTQKQNDIIQCSIYFLFQELEILCFSGKKAEKDIKSLLKTMGSLLPSYAKLYNYEDWKATCLHKYKEEILLKQVCYALKTRYNPSPNIRSEISQAEMIISKIYSELRGIFANIKNLKSDNLLLKSQ